MKNTKDFYKINPRNYETHEAFLEALKTRIRMQVLYNETIELIKEVKERKSHA